MSKQVLTLLPTDMIRYLSICEKIKASQEVQEAIDEGRPY